jgi:hypothetical protein
MANSDKNIWITPNNGSTTADPKIVFSGADASTSAQNITCQVYPTNGGTLSFEGSVGQLFSIANSMTGTIFSVNDVSGIPSIEVLDSGQVNIAQYGGNVLIGAGNNNAGTLTNTIALNAKVAVGSNFTPSYTLDVRSDYLGSIAWTRTNASVVRTHKINVPGDGSGWYIVNLTDNGTPIWANNNGYVGLGNLSSTVSYPVTTGGDLYVAGQILATSNITAYYSDGRLKENIKPIQNPISKLMAITGVTFNSNEPLLLVIQINLNKLVLSLKKFKR